MSPNSCTVRSRPRTLIDSRKSFFFGDGSAPSWPADTCTFCSRTAAITSLAVSPRDASRFGSSHSRIA